MVENSHTVQDDLDCDGIGPHSKVDFIGPKGVLECDGIVPQSEVDFTGPKGVLECGGIVTHSME